MKTAFPIQKLNREGSALVLTMFMSGVALLILGSVMAWSASNTRLTHRSIQYTRAVAAAEASTEKVVSHLMQDFLYGSEKLVQFNLPEYRKMVPLPSDSSFWDKWEFNDATSVGRTSVTLSSSNNYIVLDSTYSGLRGFASTYTVVSHAREPGSLLGNVVGGVLQEVQLASVPIFQFAMYSSGDMEISCGQKLDITGRVHANETLYIEPDNEMTFLTDVTAVEAILYQRHPDDPRGTNYKGSWVFVDTTDNPKTVTAMTLPIGTNTINTPEAVREIIQPPPLGEDPNSPLGLLRYYNQSDMIVVVSDTGITATSGKANNFLTVIPLAELNEIVTTTNSFWDAREGKTVRPIDINVTNLTTWSGTNSSLRAALGSRDLSSVYVWDRRTLPSTELGAVRVVNGMRLPSFGLTVATARPLYVQGHFNQTNSTYLGKNDTTTTKPASLVADAITILSEGWTDANSKAGVGSRVAKDTTVNAAFLTGVVETTKEHYSGGMENFPRFLETWGPIRITYNGSMVRMFPSLYATAAWNNNGDIYGPPTRNWAYDINFEDATKLPPLTPSLLKTRRSRWATVAPDKNVAAVIP